MLELVAQGKTAVDRWRKVLLQDLPFVVGRASDEWEVPWDEKVSRRHARMRLIDEQLQVEKVPEATNPIYYRGLEENSFTIHPGEHFVIGDTTFLLTDDAAFATLELPTPISQRAFSTEFLRQVRYRDADHRIAVLNRLPEIISSSNNEEVLNGQMINLLLSGIRSATAVAICRQRKEGQTEVIKWDQRNLAGGDFQPCARLIGQAIEHAESTLHLWHAADEPLEFSVDSANDWAFVCPLSGASCKGWVIYVTGLNRTGETPASGDSDELDLQGDVKFAELVGATLANLRRVQHLERRQSIFRPFFSPVVMEAFVDQEPEEVLQPRQCEISVLFCDLRGFSAKSEEMSDQLEELLDRVSQALGIMTKNVLEFGGVIGDFHGDSAMGFWGWPLERDDAAAQVCRAALTIQSEVEAIAAQPDHRLHDFQMGIGVATGNAVAGKIGTSHQVKVTAFGPVVNLAARLEGMTRTLNIPLLIDKFTVDRAKDLFSCENPTATVRYLGKFCPYGLSNASDLFQMNRAEDQPSQSILDTYSAGFQRFVEGRWPEAMDILKSIEDQDNAARFLVRFIESRELTADFDGVINLTTK